MRIFRNKHPRRLYPGPKKADYSLYLSELRRDFNNRCAYTDCSDMWWGGGFHIDHFAPQKPKVDPSKIAAFADLECEYSNLVYACPQVNRAKWNDWPSDDPTISIYGNKGYLDPCNNDLNEYFERTDSGGILPKDHPIARYMWRRLKLYLRRYEVYWRIEQIREQYKRLRKLETLKLPRSLQAEIEKGKIELADALNDYLHYLDANHLALR